MSARRLRVLGWICWAGSGRAAFGYQLHALLGLGRAVCAAAEDGVLL